MSVDLEIDPGQGPNQSINTNGIGRIRIILTALVNNTVGESERIEHERSEINQQRIENDQQLSNIYKKKVELEEERAEMERQKLAIQEGRLELDQVRMEIARHRSDVEKQWRMSVVAGRFVLYRGTIEFILFM